MNNLTFDRQKLVLTVLEDQKERNPILLIDEYFQYIGLRLQEDTNLDKEAKARETIILPRQKTYIAPKKETSHWEPKKRSRMIWSDEKKGWELRRNKKRAPDIPPIIVATKEDAYEDVFRKREMQNELQKTKHKLKKMKNNIAKTKPDRKNKQKQQ